MRTNLGEVTANRTLQSEFVKFSFGCSYCNYSCGKLVFRYSEAVISEIHLLYGVKVIFPNQIYFNQRGIRVTQLCSQRESRRLHSI